MVPLVSGKKVVPLNLSGPLDVDFGCITNNYTDLLLDKHVPVLFFHYKHNSKIYYIH